MSVLSAKSEGVLAVIHVPTFSFSSGKKKAVYTMSFKNDKGNVQKVKISKKLYDAVSVVNRQLMDAPDWDSYKDKTIGYLDGHFSGHFVKWGIMMENEELYNMIRAYQVPQHKTYVIDTAKAFYVKSGSKYLASFSYDLTDFRIKF